MLPSTLFPQVSSLSTLQVRAAVVMLAASIMFAQPGCASPILDPAPAGRAAGCLPDSTNPGSDSCVRATAARNTLTESQRQGLQHAYVMANLEFTLLHELSHAIFTELNVPIFGHEEDAADTLATVLMIRQHGLEVSTHESIRLLAVSEEWRLTWASDSVAPTQPYWDAHALAIQRYYNVNCLLAGANPAVLRALLDRPELPSDRGLYCWREFQQAKRFALWLIENYGRPASASGTTRPPAITVHFESPQSEEQAAVAAWLRDDSTVKDILGRAAELIAWQEPISVAFASCTGADSYYNSVSRMIVICYDLPVEFGRRADLILRTRSIDDICANRPLRHLIGEWTGCEPQDVGSP
jgi:hypothetical protein